MASIRQLNNSKWQVQIRRLGHKPVTKTFITKSDALVWSRQIESEIDRGIFLDRTEADRTTVSELLCRYQKEVTPKKKSAAREVSRLKILSDYLGHFSASSLQSMHIANFRDSRIKQGLSGATVLKDINTLSHVIDTAIKEWGLPLINNPVKLIRKPSGGKSRNRRLSRHEESALLCACRKSKALMLEPMVMFAIETGMRLSEMLNLKHEDVNFQKCIAVLYQTKNGESRTVPLSSKALSILTNLPIHIKYDRFFWEWSRTDSFEHTWQRAVKKSGVVDLKFHDLRHEATSRFFEKGMSMMEVSAITGHKTLQMLKRYTHLRAEDLARKLG